MRTVQAVAVVHSLPPTHPEWAKRLNRAVEAFGAGEVDAIIVTGGRFFSGGKEVFNNPRLMRTYLIEHGVPPDSIAWRDVANGDVKTAKNPADTGDEVGVAIFLTVQNGWCSAVIRPDSNSIHWDRIENNYRARARNLGLELRLEPLLIPSTLGRMWALQEMTLFRFYTLIDPGWTGPVAEWMRKRRRLGSGFGIAGGSSGKNA